MHTDSRFYRRWLIACMACVVFMVFIGGVTRLTESGLSIVEWKLFSGTFPPLSETAWRQEFAEYKTSPEFTQKNAHFTVADFQKIYWLEYLHRLMGRITGLVFLLPLIYLAIRKTAPAPFLKRMAFITALVGTQGAVGWLMVASGLEHDPRVNPLKLALHLSIAFTILSLLLWTYWQSRDTNRLARPTIARAARLLLGLVVVQIILGAIVAGMDAGYSYNTFPLMDGKLAPTPLAPLSPWWRNPLEYIPLIQFQHRCGAYAVLIAMIWFCIFAMKRLPDAYHGNIKMLAAITALQFSLGVATLLSVMHIGLASAHQLVALALVAALLRILYIHRA
jgi:heme a synthase